MVKKILLASAIFALSGSAYAAVDGFYVGGQAGYANTGFTSTDAFIPVGMVGSNKFGISGFIGANTDISQGTNAASYEYYMSSVNSSNAIGRLFVGYQFSPYIATELGYVMLTDTDSKAAGMTVTDTKTTNAQNKEIYRADTDTLKANMKESAVDFLVKFIYPVTMSNFTVYSKLGAAYLQVRQTGSFDSSSASATIASVSPNGDPTYAFGSNLSSETYLLNEKVSRIRPEAGLGVGYDITPNAELNGDVAYIFGNNNIPDIYYATVGLSYHFG